MKYDKKQKMTVAFLLLLLIFVVGTGLIYRKSQKQPYQPIDRTETAKKVETDEEPSESFVLVNKVSFSYPNRITVRIYDNGDVERSVVIDELISFSNTPQDSFVKEKKLTKEQIFQITNAIEKLKSTPKTETATENYGLSINIDNDLVDVISYSQDAIDTFSTLIDSLIN